MYLPLTEKGFEMEKGSDLRVYKSNMDFTLVIKPTEKTLISSAGGQSQMFTHKAKKVKFTNRFLTIGEDAAKKLGLSLDTLIEWIELQPSFGRKFWLVQSQDKPASPAVEKEITEAGSNKKGIKVHQGVRGRK